MKSSNRLPKYSHIGFSTEMVNSIKNWSKSQIRAVIIGFLHAEDKPSTKIHKDIIVGMP